MRPGHARSSALREPWRRRARRLSADMKTLPPQTRGSSVSLAMAEAAGIEPAMGDKPKPA